MERIGELERARVPLSGPTAIRPVAPPTSSGATVRHSSSTASAATSSPNSVGPPSQSTRCSPRRASSASTRSGREPVERDDVPARGGQPLPALARGGGEGEDDRWHAGVGEQPAGRIEQGRAGDDRDRWRRVPAAGGPAGAPVVLGPHRPGPDEDDVREPAQQQEHPAVGGGAEACGAARRPTPRRRRSPRSSRARTARRGSRGRRSVPRAARRPDRRSGQQRMHRAIPAQ